MIIIDNIDIFYKFVFHNFNNSIFDTIFLSELKNANVIPVFKKKHQNNVENYCQVSIEPKILITPLVSTLKFIWSSARVNFGSRTTYFIYIIEC